MVVLVSDALLAGAQDPPQISELEGVWPGLSARTPTPPAFKPTYSRGSYACSQAPSHADAEGTLILRFLLSVHTTQRASCKWS